VRAVLRLDLAEAEPDPRAVLERLGIGRDREPTATVSGLLSKAVDLLRRHAQPAGVVEQIARQEFEAVYAGEGKNLSPAPLDAVLPRADRLALFAATLGEDVSLEIAALFGTDDFALGYVLDAAASSAAEGLSRILARRYLSALIARGEVPADRRALDYSPGYCGWDLTGQRRLFARLVPGEAGIVLNESCLMRPLKSVSGVIAVGPEGIHRLEPVYACCATCGERSCRDRAAAAVAPGEDWEDEHGNPSGDRGEPRKG
jgi:hypothetical protein